LKEESAEKLEGDTDSESFPPTGLKSDANIMALALGKNVVTRFLISASSGACCCGRIATL
jgi:hypothetical protein